MVGRVLGDGEWRRSRWLERKAVGGRDLLRAGVRKG